MSSRTSERFLLASAALALAGCVVAAATPLAAGASRAFVGSIVASGAVGAVFAGRNLQLYRERGRPSIPAASLTTVFGVWLVVAPLQYDPGAAATAGVQFGGMLVGAFGAYVLVAGLAGSE